MTGLRRRARSWWVLVALSAVAPPAEAQPLDEPSRAGTAPDGPDDDEARALYTLGDRRYAEGDYEGAIVAFEKALALSGRRQIHFSIANAQERLDQLEAAEASLRRYLDVAPPEERATIMLRIESLQRRVAARPPPPPPPPCPTLPPPKPTPVAPPPPAHGSLDAVGYAVVGVGGAGLVAGAILGGLALAARGEAQDGCAGDLCSAGAQSALDRDRLLSGATDVALGLGAAGVIAGTLILVLGPSEQEAVALGAYPGGLWLKGAF